MEQYYLLASVLYFLLCSPWARAFTPHPSSRSNARTTTTTTTTTTSRNRNRNTPLYISSWTSDRPRTSDSPKRDPEQYLQDYIPEPQAVEARSGIDSTLLLSGLAGRDRGDQFLLDLLHHQDSAFDFDTLTLLVPSAKVAKKTLLSRSARYTGLLDALEFVEEQAESDETAAESSDLILPTVEQLTNPKVTTWMVVLSSDPNDTTTTTSHDDTLLATCETIASLAAQASGNLEQVAVLMTGVAAAADASTSLPACEAAFTRQLGGTEVAYTLVAVGELHDGPEGGNCYQYTNMTAVTMESDTASPSPSTLASTSPRFSREEAYRIVTELLQLECGVNRALFFTELVQEYSDDDDDDDASDDIVDISNITEYKLIKGLREAGYARMQEMDYMIREGPESYTKAVDEWRSRHPDWDKGYTTDIWWEAPEYQETAKLSSERDARLEALKKEQVASEVEVLAKDWVRRDYFQQTIKGSVDSSVVSEEDHSKAVWERALKEGEWAYRKSRGELTEAERKGELQSFKEEQAKKQQVMLEKAKAELASVMKEDLTDDVDVTEDDDSDDDDE